MRETNCEFPFDKVPRLGAFPLPIYQRAVNEVVRAHKVPPKLAQYGALAAAGALAQMLVDVQKPAGGVVSAGVYILLQGTSGERKTTIDQCFFGELRKLSKAGGKRHSDEVATYRVREKIWKLKNKMLMDALKTACATGKNTDAVELAILESEKNKPREPRELKLVFNDVTMAALKNALWDSPNATLLSSDGRKILQELLLQNDSELNQMWSGETIDVKRVSVPSFTLDDVRLTFSVMIQSDALSRIMLTKGKVAKESGFFARVIFSDVGSTIGQRLIDVIETPNPDLDSFNRRVATVLTEYVEAMEAGSCKRQLIKFDAEASRAWIAYFNYVESNIKEGGRYDRAGDHASKLADNVARAAADLHVLEGFDGDIGMDCLLSAIALCDQASKDYMQHLGPKDEDEIEALALKDWLVEKYVKKRTTWIDLNRLLQFAPNRMRVAKNLHRYLEILERGEYLTVWPPGSGGRTKAQVELRMDGAGQARSMVPPLYSFLSARSRR